MLTIEKVSKTIPNFEYIFDKAEDFYSLLPYLRNKIKGEWHIALVEPKLEVIRELYSLTMPEYVNITVYLEPNTYEAFMLEHPEAMVKEKNNFQLFKDYINSLPQLFEPKAVQEIYKRIGSNLPQLKDEVSKLISKYNKSIITVKDVQAFIPKNDIIYPSQVINQFLLFRPVYRWNTLEKFVNHLGPQRAFFTLRKHIASLFEDKINFLKGRTDPNFLTTKIDVNTILRAHFMFQQASSYKQLIPIMACIDQKSLIYNNDGFIYLQKEEN